MNTDELPPILESKLSDFRRRVWIVKLAEGLLAACFGIALSYVLVFVLDRFMETPAWLRGVLLASGAAVLGFGVPLKWHRWVWRQRRLEDAARLLRRRFPRLGDQLLGIVELARKDSVSGRSETLVQAAMAQAAEAVKDKDFSKAVPHARHRAWGLAAGGVVALALVAFITVSDAARNALARWLTPWREVDRYTFARVDQLPKNLVVPFAEPFSLPVKLSSDTKWSPERGTGRIKGQPEVNVALQNGGYPLAFPPQKNDAPMSVSLGDVRKTVQVEPRTRPELATLTARLRLPEYLKYKTEPGIEVRGGSISVLKGSQVSFIASASRDLAEAEMDGAKQKVEGDKLLTNYTAVENSGERHFNWRDTLGLAPREPLVLKVQAVEDEAPRITARRDSQETVVLDSEVLTFDLSIADDFGVKSAGLEWVGEKTSSSDIPLRGEKLAVAGEPEKRDLDARATFCATREKVAPQTLQVRAWAEDYLPGRKRTYSQSFILHILNKQEHALWLTEQFAKWLQVARESYEREQQLHQTNKELRELSSAELDRPENRRKIQQQASSERANADRLENITQLGKSLVEQATHNPEFEAKRLEAWADMLKNLKDIAADKMPSVADLLKQSSNAATKSMASSNPGKPSPGDQKSQPSSSQNPPGKPPTGDQKSQPSTAQNSSGKPPEAGEQKPGDSKPSAPQVTTGEQNPSTDKPKPSDPNAEKKPAVPNIADNEKSNFKPEDKNPDEKPKPPQPAGSGKLSLPQTTLGAAPSDKKPDEESAPDSPAQDKMQKAVAEQRDLLAEFAKVADQLNEIMAGLEASTFVKRLKLASRTQMTVSSDLNSKTLSAFGLERKDVTTEPAAHVDAIAGREKDQSEVVRVIQSDLEAYYQRRQDERFKNILEQMKKSEITSALLRTGDQTGVNLSGRSIASSEFWADTLDRWAEELVSASESSKSKPGKSGDKPSLPPEIILMVMQALRDEMQLRDETREMENARPALTKSEYVDKAPALARKQERNAVLTQSASDAILMLPDGSQNFGDELKLLTAVRQVMDEAGGILDKPDTGSEAIAAETEAIELLLQAKRQSKGGGGGGGGGNPGGGGSGSASGMSLAELGPGADSPAQAVVRPVGQQTGRAGREFPEEFKSGLDAYFNKLEGQGGSKP